MRRLYIGAVLLVVLLALGVGIAVGMDGIHARSAAALDAAADAALDGDWQTAQLLSQQAQQMWQQNWQIVACVADHTPMDEIDALFAQLPAFVRGGEDVHFAATCAQLAQLLQAMGDAQRPDWWSLL